MCETMDERSDALLADEFVAKRGFAKARDRGERKRQIEAAREVEKPPQRFSAANGVVVPPPEIDRDALVPGSLQRTI